MPKVRWSHDEIAVVARAYYAQRSAGKSRSDALVAAQQTLPQGRRKVLRFSSQRLEVARLVEKHHPTPPATPAPATPQPQPQPQPQPTTPPVIAAPTLDESLQAVGERIADQIAHTMFQRMKGRLQQLAEEFVKREALPRPRVLVVGPIGPQQRLLEGEFGGVLDLRFVASSEPAYRIKEMAPSCAKILLWTNYINHTHQEMAKGVLSSRPGDRIYVTGGMEALREKLLELGVQ